MKAKHLLIWEHDNGNNGTVIGSPAKIDAEIERRRTFKGGRLTRYALTKTSARPGKLMMKNIYLLTARVRQNKSEPWEEVQSAFTTPENRAAFIADILARYNLVELSVVRETIPDPVLAP